MQEIIITTRIVTIDIKIIQIPSTKIKKKQITIVLPTLSLIIIKINIRNRLFATFVDNLDTLHLSVRRRVKPRFKNSNLNQPNKKNRKTTPLIKPPQLHQLDQLDQLDKKIKQRKYVVNAECRAGILEVLIVLL